MLEVATSILDGYLPAAAEIEEIRSSVQRAAFQVGAAISGGGAHPFQKWNEQRIYPKERYRESAKKYGYLAKMFTVFGMHVHIGMHDADEAIRVCAWLTQRAPLFIALSAASPCWQGEDSGFCSARSNVVGAFPMSGIMPSHIRTWDDFSAHFGRLAGHGIVNSIKDFYWDVRPKPEYGTIELRVLDTPLHPAYAAALACYARELCIEAAAAPGVWPEDDSTELYAWNRFNAAKDGVEANWIKPCTGIARPVREVVRDDLERLAARSTDPGFGQACRMIEALMEQGGQARWLTAHLAAGAGMNDLSRVASEIFEHPLGARHDAASAERP
jgi:carboxylate-amine ligase